MSGQARDVSISVTINGVNISDSVEPSLLEIRYKETWGDTLIADTLDISIADPEGLFRQKFTFSTYMPVDASITINNWNVPGISKMTKTISQMFVKSVRIDEDKGSGTKIRISCTSIPPQSPFRLQRKSTQSPAPGAEPTTLRTLATQVCQQDGITGGLQMTAPDQSIGNVTQHDHSDAYLLHRLCKQDDYNMKVVNNTMYITDAAAAEATASLGTIMCPTNDDPGGWQGSGMIRWEFREETEDTQYATATSSAFDVLSGQPVKAEAQDPRQTEGPALTLHEEPISPVTEQKIEITPIIPEVDTDQP